MPDDDQQKQHAQSVATERFLTQQWNVPRNQVRERLHEVARIMATQRAIAQAAQQTENSTPAPFPKPAEIQTDSRRFDPKPLTLGVDPAEQVQPPPGATSGGQIPNVIIVFNGTADYCTLGGQITGPV